MENSSKKGAIFSANYETFNLNKIRLENKQNFVQWKCNLAYLEKGDSIVVYYTNLPDGVAKVLYMCEVISEKPYVYDGAKYIDLEIKYVVKKEHFAKFTRDNLINNYGIVNMQNKIYLNPDNVKHVKLITDIQKYSDVMSTDSFNSMEKQVLECDCFFKDFYIDGKKMKHGTFVLDNGYHFFNVHHFVQRKSYEQLSWDLNKRFENNINSVKLCVVCHNRIHNGKKSDIKCMVNEISNRDDRLKELMKLDNNNILDETFILSSYGISK